MLGPLWILDSHFWIFLLTLVLSIFQMFCHIGSILLMLTRRPYTNLSFLFQEGDFCHLWACAVNIGQLIHCIQPLHNTPLVCRNFQARSVKGIVIPQADERLMLQCRKTFLFCEGEPWTKISYVWKIKDKNLPFTIRWSIKAQGHPYNGGKSCDLCNSEKLIILTENQNTMLNKRDELLETCRHRRKYLLGSMGITHLDNG